MCEQMFLLGWCSELALQMKKAFITTSGIEVEGNVYTCSLAVKEQWFNKVMDTGPIEVDFFLDPENQNEGVLSLSVGYEFCLRVEHTNISREVQVEYFEQLEKMKKAFNRKMKNKLRDS